MTRTRVPLRWWLVVLPLVLGAGCSSATPRPETVVFPCLPPGVSAAFFTWPVVEFQGLTLPRDNGDEVAAASVLYRHGSRAVGVIWVGGDLLAVDPSPESDEPQWEDASLLTEDGTTLRSEPEAPCQWRRHGDAA